MGSGAKCGGLEGAPQHLAEKRSWLEPRFIFPLFEENFSASLALGTQLRFQAFASEWGLVQLVQLLLDHNRVKLSAGPMIHLLSSDLLQYNLIMEWNSSLCNHVQTVRIEWFTGFFEIWWFIIYTESAGWQNLIQFRSNSFFTICSCPPCQEIPQNLILPVCTYVQQCTLYICTYSWTKKVPPLP